MLSFDIRNSIEEIFAQMGSSVRIKRDVPLKDLTTIRVGGPVAYVVFAKDRESLMRLTSMLSSKSIPWRVIGKGSNILGQEKGFEGVLVLLEGEFIDYKVAKETLTAGAAISIPQLMAICLKEGLGGLEFLIGIPGTVGGAVKMNAGAFSMEIKDCLLSVECISPDGFEILSSSSIRFGYRESSISDSNIIISATFKITKTPVQEIRAKMKQYMERRRKTQPIAIGSMGSVFKNPPGDYAGRLIEQAGLKGTRIGGAYVSEKHANFILNDGTATSNDVWQLIGLVKSRVKEMTNITLDLEVHTLEA